MQTTRKQQIEKITDDYIGSFGSLDSKTINWKPNPDTWSIGQVIDHVITTNKTYFPVIEQLRSGTYRVPFIGKINFFTNFFGNFILNSVSPDRKKKMKTFPIWYPVQGNVVDGIMQRFAEHQENLVKLMEESSDLVTSGIVISSPANKYIVYKLDKAFDIIIGHEIRHYNQAMEILTSQSPN